MNSTNQPTSNLTTEVDRFERPLPPLPPSSPESIHGEDTSGGSVAVQAVSDLHPDEELSSSAPHGASLGAAQGDSSYSIRNRSRSSSHRSVQQSRSASRHGSLLRPQVPGTYEDLYSAGDSNTLSRTSSIHGGGALRTSRPNESANVSTPRSRSPSQTLMQALQLPPPSASRSSQNANDSDDDTPLLSHTSPSQIRQRQHRASTTEPVTVEFSVPRWQPDAEVTMCPICRTQFGFFVRKHHCRKCGRVVCSACSPHRITIPYQYIVQPPSEGSPTAATEDRPCMDNRVNSWNSVGSIGGGERVRLCNPCVPDPNTAPPQSPLPHLRQSLQQSHTRSASAVTPSNSLGHYRAREEVERMMSGSPRRQRESSLIGGRPSNGGRGVISPDRGLRPDLSESRSRSSTVGNPREASNSQFLGTVNAFSARSPSGASRTIQQAFRPLTARMDDQLPPRPRLADRRRIPEEDECWICHLELPSRTLHNFEKLRESHVESCIAAAMGGSSPTPTPAVASPVPPPHRPRAPSVRVSSSSTPQAQASSSSAAVPVPLSNTPEAREARMRAREEAHAAVVFAQSQPSSSSPGPVRRTGVFPYQATEKDCVDDAECTICLEEFEPGVEMGRLECFCRFHLRCIRQWFEKHPGQCPVHQHGAGY